ncbi:hypothetical protein ABKN59_007388 [Abortiporus biennis]
MILSSYSATISIVDTLGNTKLLEEHQVESNMQEKVVSCYIASEVGQRFTIKVENDDPSEENRVTLALDGLNVHSAILDSTSRSFSFTSVCMAEDKCRYLQFSKLNVTNDENALSTSQRQWEQVGTIKTIYCIDITLISKGKRNKGLKDTACLADDGSIHELSKKAGAHCIG